MILAPRERIEELTARGWWGTRRIHDWLDVQITRRPDALALVDPPNRERFVDGRPRRLTWRELGAEVQRLAQALARLGVAKDDVVLVQLPNCAELPIAYLACMRLGAIITPVPIQYREHELVQIAALARPRIALTAERILSYRHAEMLRALIEPPGRVVALGDPVLGPDSAGLRAEAEVDANEVATLCWTSGTEGVPKGVPRSHNEWLSIPENMILAGRLTEGCTLLNPFPLVNMAGIAGQFLPWLITGGKLVLHHPFDLNLFVTQLREEAVDYSIASPATLTVLAQNEGLLAGLRLRALGSGGGSLPEWTLRVLTERHGIDVTNYFGTNEGASLTASSLDLPEPAQRASYFPRFGAGTHQWRLPVSRRVLTKLVDPESGEEIQAPGRPGELRVKGPAIFSGYWRSPEMTARAFDAQGWFRTGDLFEIAGDERQLYRFVGRLKDIIVRGGFNISSEEVEALLLEHPAVREAAVIGYPDQRLGERVCAAVVAQGGSTPTLEELTGFLRTQKRVAVYKLPERLLLLQALPRNAFGKVLKRVLRERLQA